jgi:anti-sigma B factor antagonist
MSKLTITIDQHQQATVIRLSGSADMAEANSLKNQLDQYPTAEHNNLVVDLSDLHFISSMGLGSLIQAHRQCQEGRGHLSLVSPQESVARVLKTTQLDQLFDIYPSVEAALAGKNKHLPEKSNEL